MNEHLERTMRKLEEARKVLSGESPAADHRPVVELIADAAYSVTQADPDDRLKDLFAWDE